MKFKTALIISLILAIVSFDSLNCYRKRLRGPTETTTTEEKPDEKPKEKFDKPDVGQIWDDLFTAQRGSTCKAEETKKNILSQIRAEQEKKMGKEQGGDMTLIVSDSSFAWIENWGFGPVAYLLDFLDPVFQKDIVNEFKLIYNSTIHESPENIPEYSDMFDYAGRLSTAPPSLQAELIRELKKFEKHYSKDIYDKSVNSVQIFKALKEFKWFTDPGNSDYASDFVARFDINKDGRLSPKELILGAIIWNKRVIGSTKCTHCFSEVGRKLKALFTYLDCGETGFVSADQLWKNLPDLKRGTNNWDIFGIKADENIRSDAINDFILKNHKAKDASVSQEEFVTGILLGVWQRQVTDLSIVEDDSRNLKSLRWSADKITDKVANKYLIDITRQRIEEEEKQAYLKWESKQRKEALKAKQAWDEQHGK